MLRDRRTERLQAERRMILVSAGTSERRSAFSEQASRWTELLDWAQLADNLRDRKLLPVLGPRILELAHGQASEGFVATVERATAATQRHGNFLLLMCERVMAALAEAQIRAGPLKGPVLAEAIYGDPGKRLSSDIDVLVAPEDLQAAVEVVRGLGYGPPTDRVGRDGLPLLHYALEHERGELPPVELHWRIHWYERTFAKERLLPPLDDHVKYRLPLPADELAALLLFYARDGFVDLRLATDLSTWWDAFGADVPIGALDDLVEVYPALSRAIRAAAEVSEKVVGLPAARLLDNPKKLGVRGAMAARLANPNPRTSRAQLYADMGFIDGLLMPPGNFTAFIRRQVLLPREVLNEYAQLTPQKHARSPLDYSLRVLVRYGVTAFRMLRAPEALT
jgi:hypothetical protein